MSLKIAEALMTALMLAPHINTRLTRRSSTRAIRAKSRTWASRLATQILRRFVPSTSRPTSGAARIGGINPVRNSIVTPQDPSWSAAARVRAKSAIASPTIETKARSTKTG
ncbi:hypothetical protein [Arthrobacter sp. 179]|uniref:hypothetical protein n=1 Tax=Arthrobacter sp. 179 TaxID=3457734 RepID=UPI00264DCEDF|nr:hypothetical protein [Micrococcaceae bacterium]